MLMHFPFNQNKLKRSVHTKPDKYESEGLFLRLGPTVHTNPSRERTEFLKAEQFENAGLDESLLVSSQSLWG